jgi:cob(I)alamin adenosyltransferase
LIQIYTGDGKGKTTAALGLLLRAVGAGLRVALLQFDKGPPETREGPIGPTGTGKAGRDSPSGDPAPGGPSEKSVYYSERNVLRTLKNVRLIVTGCGRVQPGGGFRFGCTEADRREAERGLREAKALVEGNGFDMVILDEILSAADTGLIEEAAVLEIVAAARRRPELELVLTGRGASEVIMERADLVTEMRKVKHYFDRGVGARPGIEY